MEVITTFLNMGGYGAFVWPAFLLTALVMTVLLITTLRQLRRRQRELAEIETGMPGRKRTWT